MRFFGADVVGREVAHHLVFDRDQIAANGPILRAELDALRGGFHRRPAGEVSRTGCNRSRLRLPISEPAGSALGVWQARATTPIGHDAIHVRRVRGFERRLAAERFLRLIGRTVGDYDGVFHVDSR